VVSPAVALQDNVELGSLETESRVVLLADPILAIVVALNICVLLDVVESCEVSSVRVLVMVVCAPSSVVYLELQLQVGGFSMKV
jgi:hypothetical protein